MRILVTGPECTGKSTLSRSLSQHMQIPWFPEHARTYLAEKGRDYVYEDIADIAKEHMDFFHCFPSDQPMIMDTYLYNLKIWSEYKYGKCDDLILKGLEQTHKFDHVFLLYPDLSWRQDGYRENEENGLELFRIFQSELSHYSQPFHIIKGKGPTRLETALAAI